MALENRPDYRQQKITLQNSEINIKGANNGLLPTVDLIAFYGGSGLAGVPNPLGCTGIPQHFQPSLRQRIRRCFQQSVQRQRPDKGVQINIQIPLGNRVAQSVQVRSMLEYRQSQLSLKTVENVITIGIRNDAFTLENNRASVAAAQTARDLAAQTLDAEQKKYNLGASTYLAVLQDERDLAQSESTLVSAMTSYAKARVQLDRDTAQTLDRVQHQDRRGCHGANPHRTKCARHCSQQNRSPGNQHSGAAATAEIALFNLRTPPAGLLGWPVFVVVDILRWAVARFSHWAHSGTCRSTLIYILPTPGNPPRSFLMELDPCHDNKASHCCFS